MADNRNVSGSVTVQQDSRHRVAYDLMDKIAFHESSPERNKREYWLKLYAQCYGASVGDSSSDAIKRG